MMKLFKNVASRFTKAKVASAIGACALSLCFSNLSYAGQTVVKFKIDATNNPPTGYHNPPCESGFGNSQNDIVDGAAYVMDELGYGSVADRVREAIDRPEFKRLLGRLTGKNPGHSECKIVCGHTPKKPYKFHVNLTNKKNARGQELDFYDSLDLQAWAWVELLYTERLEGWDGYNSCVLVKNWDDYGARKGKISFIY